MGRKELRRRGHARVVRHVEGDAECVDSGGLELRDGVLAPGIVSGADPDAPAEVAEPQRDGVPDALVAAGDECCRHGPTLRRSCGWVQDRPGLARYPEGMETRELRYFVAVAEELHFGRPAQRLAMAQPPLSRAVGQLERRLGVQLLARTSRGAVLTAAGVVLLAESRAALDAVDAAERRTRRAGAAGGSPRVVLVTKAGASTELLAKLLDAYAVEPGAAPVDVELCGMGQQERWLRDGRADVALLHRPFDSTTGLDVEELGTQGQVVVLPSGHPLSTRRSLLLADVVDLPFVRWPHQDGTYPDGPGPEVRDHEQMFQLVALGRAVTVVPEQVRDHLRWGLAAVPALDAPSVTTVIAWPPHSRSRAVADLVRVATQL